MAPSHAIAPADAKKVNGADHMITGHHAGCAQRDDQRVRAVCDCDASMRHTTEGGEALLEGFHLGPEDVLAAAQDAQHGLFQSGAELRAFRGEIDRTDGTKNGGRCGARHRRTS